MTSLATQTIPQATPVIAFAPAVFLWGEYSINTNVVKGGNRLAGEVDLRHLDGVRNMVLFGGVGVSNAAMISDMTASNLGVAKGGLPSGHYQRGSRIRSSDPGRRKVTLVTDSGGFRQTPKACNEQCIRQ